MDSVIKFGGGNFKFSNLYVNMSRELLKGDVFQKCKRNENDKCGKPTSNDFLAGRYLTSALIDLYYFPNFGQIQAFLQLNNFLASIHCLFKSLECSSMVSLAAFSPGDQGSNPSWFSVSNLNQKIEFPGLTQACGTLASTVTQ